MIQKRSITKFLSTAKLYTMKNIISKTLINNEIKNKEFTITMSKTKKILCTKTKRKNDKI